MTTATTMTAAQHFAKGEELLAAAEKHYHVPEIATVDALRAQGHFAAARLLLDAEALANPRRALRCSGFDDVLNHRSR